MLKIETFVFNPFQENCYIVSDNSGEAIIIDCGAFFKEERDEIIEYINNNKLEVKGLYATHGHIDHNFGINTIYEHFNCKPQVHINDQKLIEKLPQQALVFCNIKLDYEIPPMGTYLNDEETIKFGEHQLRIIHTPGHSLGSVIFYCEEEKIAFTGDTLFRMSIGRTDLEGGSYEMIVNSLRKIKATLPEDTTILPGHGSSSTIKEEILMNPYLNGI